LFIAVGMLLAVPLGLRFLGPSDACVSGRVDRRSELFPGGWCVCFLDLLDGID
jgi:hypothetical protein